MKRCVQGLLLALTLMSWQGLALQFPASGNDLLTGKKVEIKAGKRGAVLVFMSTRCPCSNSHNEVMKKLAEEFKDFTFYVVHSNADEDLAEAKSYFENAGFKFPVIQDDGTKLADDLKAARTPHAFVFNAKNELVFKGGPTDSRSGETAERQYLREALKQLEAGKPVKVAEARALGCAISRN